MPMSEERAAGRGREPILDLDRSVVRHGAEEERFGPIHGRGAGLTRGRESSFHRMGFRRGALGLVFPLGHRVGVLAGTTLASRVRGQGPRGIACHRDDATSTGTWHEGFNFAAAQRCPLNVVVRAKGRAFSTPTSKQTRVLRFTDKAAGHGIGAESVDGTDGPDVYRATRRAADRARAGEGSQRIELRYERRMGHAQRDPQESVDSDELHRWGRDEDAMTNHRALLQCA